MVSCLNALYVYFVGVLFRIFYRELDPDPVTDPVDPDPVDPDPVDPDPVDPDPVTEPDPDPATDPGPVKYFYSDF